MDIKAKTIKSRMKNSKISLRLGENQDFLRLQKTKTIKEKMICYPIKILNFLLKYKFSKKWASHRLEGHNSKTK